MLNDQIAAVRDYYEQQVDREWYRLTRHRIEFAVTLRALRDELQPKTRILDAGGGPGRYSVALAGAGHLVTLLDLAPRMLARALDHARDRRVQLAGCVEGSATDLSHFRDGSFDAVLLLGPLYHLTDAEARFRALREARRVLTEGGLLLAAFLSRFAPLRNLAQTRPQQLIKQAPRYEALLAGGVLPPPWEDGEVPHAYYARCDEITPLIVAAGFETPRLLAAEGILDQGAERVGALQGSLWDAWADLNYDLAGDPGLLSAATHLLAVTHRKKTS